MNTNTRKLTFTLPLLLAAGLLALMFHSASGAASFQRGAPRSSHVLYVDADASGGATGLSWTDAYTNLQDALAAASSGNEVWVAEGVYYPDEGAGQTDDVISSTFYLTDSVELYGGFAATETLHEQRDWEAHVSVLSGDLDQNDITDAHGVVTDTANIAGTNALHVVTGSGTDATAVLDGFSITAGQADGAHVYPCGPRCGGGMYNDGGSPTLDKVSFSGNTAVDGGGMYNLESSPMLTDVSFTGNAAYWGGGIYNYGGSPTLTDVSFSGNTAELKGGGMVNYASDTILTSVTFSGNAAQWDGGGMYNGASSPMLTDVTFSSNTAVYYGGGMVNDVSSPTLTDVSFSGNAANEGGGGMYNYWYSNPTLTNVSFSGNTAYHGGGMLNWMSNPTLTNVSFSGNTTEGDGGGMYNEQNSIPTLTNVSFSGNAAGEDGGGMYNDVSSPTLTDVSFSGNTAEWNGGGMYNYESSPELTDVSFSGNTAFRGGGMYNTSGSNPTLTNVTFSGNDGGWHGGGMYNTNESNPAIRNSILWNNQDGGGTDASAQIHNEGGSIPLISYTLVMSSGGSGPGWDTTLGTDGGGNLDADPLFITPVDPNDAPTTEGNLRLQSDSPAIDAGDDSYVTTPTDLDGNPRIVGDAVDMGAYENQGFPSVAPIADQTMSEYQTLTVSVSASDPHGDDLSLSFSNLPTFASASDNGAGTGAITFTTGLGDAGIYPNIAVFAIDPGGLSDTESFTLTVQASPRIYLPLILR